MPMAVTPQRLLLDLLPVPLDYASLSRRIEEISAGAIKEDDDAIKMGGGEVIVRVDDYLETDDPLWGEERFAIGPL
jgi:hypothetical protein